MIYMNFDVMIIFVSLELFPFVSFDILDSLLGKSISGTGQ